MSREQGGNTVRNVVVIVSDTLRRDHLEYGGHQLARTPRLAQLAAESVVFERAFSGSFPTLPCRAEMFTGRSVFPYLGWGPLPNRWPTLAESFARAGHQTALITDNLHLGKSGQGYDRGFHSKILVRGQLYDNFQPLEGPVEWPCREEALRPGKRTRQYLRNISVRQREEDYFAPQVVSRAQEWLESHHHQCPFFLHVDLFDPHEPWDPPAADRDLYDRQTGVEDITYAEYGPTSRFTEAEMRRMRALYAGEVTLVDRWVGKLLDTLDALGRRDDTAVVFLSDHGILIGERGLLGKGIKQTGMHGWPLYREIASVPLLFRVPGVAPRVTEAFAHPGDVSPTILELAGVPVPPTFNMRSLRPVLENSAEQVRNCAVSSWSLNGLSRHKPSVLRTEEWCLVFWRSGIPPELYNLREDPGETRNVASQHPTEVRRLHRQYLEFLREVETPPGNYLPRCWLPPSFPTRAPDGTAYDPGKDAA